MKIVSNRRLKIKSPLLFEGTLLSNSPRRQAKLTAIHAGKGGSFFVYPFIVIAATGS